MANQNNPTDSGYTSNSACPRNGKCNGNCTCTRPAPVQKIEEEVRLHCDYICPQDVVIPAGYLSLTATNTGREDLLKDGKLWACKIGDTPNVYCFPAKGAKSGVYGSQVTFSMMRTKEEILADDKDSLNNHTMSLDVCYPNTPGGKKAKEELLALLHSMDVPVEPPVEPEPPTGPMLLCETCPNGKVNAFNSQDNTTFYYCGSDTNGNIIFNSWSNRNYTGNDIATAVDLNIDYCNLDGSLIRRDTVSNGATSTDLLFSQFPPFAHPLSPGDRILVKVWWISDSGIRAEMWTMAEMPAGDNGIGQKVFHHAIGMSTEPFACDGTGPIASVSAALFNTTDYMVSASINGTDIGGALNDFVIPPDLILVGHNVLEIKSTVQGATGTLNGGIIMEFTTECA